MRKISIGIQLTMDFFDLPPHITDDPEQIRRLIHTVAEEAGVKILQEHFERFAPVGITGIAIVSESHIAVHTWPEYRYLALDFFSCRKSLPPTLIPRLEEVLGTRNYRCQVWGRNAYAGEGGREFE